MGVKRWIENFLEIPSIAVAVALDEPNGFMIGVVAGIFLVLAAVLITVVAIRLI